MLEERKRHPKCKGYKYEYEPGCFEYDCEYNTNLICEDCKYNNTKYGRKDPEAKINQIN